MEALLDAVDQHLDGELFAIFDRTCTPATRTIPAADRHPDVHLLKWAYKLGLGVMRNEHGGAHNITFGTGGCANDPGDRRLGTGQMGPVTVERLPGTVPDAEVVAVSDVFVEGAKQVAEQVGARPYSDGHELSPTTGCRPS